MMQTLLKVALFLNSCKVQEIKSLWKCMICYKEDWVTPVNEYSSNGGSLFHSRSSWRSFNLIVTDKCLSCSRLDQASWLFYSATDPSLVLVNCFIYLVSTFQIHMEKKSGLLLYGTSIFYSNKKQFFFILVLQRAPVLTFFKCLPVMVLLSCPRVIWCCKGKPSADFPFLLEVSGNGKNLICNLTSDFIQI